MDVLLISLIGWINLYTDYDTLVDLPNVVFTEQANLCQNYGISNPGTCRATQLKGFIVNYLSVGWPDDCSFYNVWQNCGMLVALVAYRMSGATQRQSFSRRSCL